MLERFQALVRRVIITIIDYITRYIIVTLNRITGKDKDILLLSSLTGFVFLDGVYTSAVINYAIHGELNISLLRSVCMKVKNKGYANFDAAIQVCINVLGCSISYKTQHLDGKLHYTAEKLYYVMFIYLKLSYYDTLILAI